MVLVRTQESPQGPAGPRGEQGPPGKLPIVKLWRPEAVFYAGDVVAFNSGSFVALKDAPGPCPVRLAADRQPGQARRCRREGRARPSRLTDGSDGPPLEPRGLFEQSFVEAR